MLNASLSLDLDNEWSFMQTRGDPGWREYPSYLDDIVPRIIDFFSRRDTKITFFIIGKDATIEANRKALVSIAEHGHEIGNHSFNHEPWLSSYSREEVANEIAIAEQAIEDVTGVVTRAFRAPGYSYSASTLGALIERGYDYDCSSFPNSLILLSRLYFFRSAVKMDEEDSGRRRALFGNASEALKPIRPYYCVLGDTELLEIPVTAMPITKFPIHFSYVLYLSKYSKRLAIAYFFAAMAACRLMRVEPSLLFHPLDFMGVDDDYETLAFFPGMDIRAGYKIEILHRCLDILERSFELIPMGEHARRIRQRSLPRRCLAA